MPRITFDDFSKGWWPTVPNTSVPKSALLDAIGVGRGMARTLKSRFGCTRICITGRTVQSTYSWSGFVWIAKTDGKLLYVLGSDASLSIKTTGLGGFPLRFAEGTPNPDTDATKFPNGLQHLFYVGGGLSPSGADVRFGIFPLRKIDTNLRESPMGLDRPRSDFVVALQDPITVEYSNFGGDLPFWVPVNCTRDGGVQFQTFTSLRMTVLAGETGHITRTKSVNLGSVNTTFNNVVGQVKSVKQDWIRLWVHCVDPKAVSKIDLIFDVGGPAPTPTDAEAGWEKAFSYSIFVSDTVQDDTIKAASVTDTAGGAEKRDAKPYYAGGVNQPSTIIGQEEDDQDVPALALPDVESIRVVADMATTRIADTANTWTHLRIPKVLFDASSEELQKDYAASWAKVRRCRLIVTANEELDAVVTVDDIDCHFGIGMQGDYKIAITHRNSVTGTRSAPSVIKEVKGNLRQGIVISQLRFTGESSLFIDQVEEWRTLGGGNVLFLAKQYPINGLIFGEQIIDFVADYEGMYEKNSLPGIGEVPYLKNIIMPEDNVRLSPRTHDIAGPYLGRMFSIDRQDQGRCTYSPPGRLEVAAGFIRITDGNDPLRRVVLWRNIYLWSQKHIYRIEGTQEPFLPRELSGCPGTLYPESLAIHELGICYYSDGPKIFDGTSSRPLFLEPVDEYFRGQGSTQVAVLNPNFMLSNAQSAKIFGVVYRDEYFLSDGQRTLAVHLRTGVWRTLGIGFGPGHSNQEVLNVIINPTSAANSKLVQWERPGVFTDDESVITFSIETAGQVLEDQSGRTKIIQFVYLDIDTNSQNVTATLLTRDGSSTLLGIVNTPARQHLEFPVLLVSDLVALRLSAGLSGGVELFSWGVDVHLPEQGGAQT